MKKKTVQLLIASSEFLGTSKKDYLQATQNEKNRDI